MTPASPAKPERILPFVEARKLVEAECGKVFGVSRASLHAEKVQLGHSRGRVLAEQIAADRDLPPFARATRDGFALRAADVASASEQSPVELRVVGEIRAGAAQLPSVNSGAAAAIMTGAPCPPGADAVLMVEHTRSQSANHVNALRTLRSGENIVPAGAEARRGANLLAPGTRMDPSAIALAASAGRSSVQVYAKPKIAILATGDELVGVEATPSPHQIRNSNSHSLAAQVEAAGAEAVLLAIAPDEPARLAALISEGLQHDLLLISGGVSAGNYDLVEPVLANFSAEFFFTGSLIQPGRPIVFGRAKTPPNKETYFFGLPGNPVSTLVTFDLFVRPMVEALSSAAPTKLHFLQAPLKKDIAVRTGLTRFLPATLSGEFEHTEVELVPWQGSGDMVASARANCYIVVPPERERIAAGEMVAIMLRSAL